LTILAYILELAGELDRLAIAESLKENS